MSEPGLVATRFDRPGVEACEYVGPDGWYWSRGERLYRSETVDSRLDLVARVPADALRSRLATTRWGRRLARHQFYNVLPLSGGKVFYTFGMQIGVLQHGEPSPLAGHRRPARILRNGVARLPDGSLLFGEYLDNAERGVVEITRLTPSGAEIETVYRFAPGEIRHVHSVSWDPYTGRVVVATGDLSEECRLLSFRPDFSDREVLGEGSESWRVISPQFSRDAIFYGTDAEFRRNVIRRYDRSTGAVDDLADVNGPVFYSAPFADGWVFGTAAELCESQTTPEAILYYIDRDSGAPSIVSRFTKDRLSTKYFQFGLLSFPTVEAPIETLPVSGTALRVLDAKFVAVTRAGMPREQP